MLVIGLKFKVKRLLYFIILQITTKTILSNLTYYVISLDFCHF